MGSLVRRSVLTAYLDGELTDAQRRRLEAALDRSGLLRSQLEALQRVARAVRTLPTANAPRKTIESVLSRIQQRSPSVADLDISPQEVDLLLAAYAHGELDNESAAEVERVLLASAEHRGAVLGHRRISRALDAFHETPVPPEVLSHVLERLHRLVEAQPALSRGGKRPFGEWITAFLDREVDDHKRHRVEARLAQSERARQMLKGFSRVRDGLAHIPRVAAPTGLMESVVESLLADEIPVLEPDVVEAAPAMDAEWLAAGSPLTARSPRTHGWLTLGLSAACVLLALAGVWSIQALAPSSPVKQMVANAPPPAPKSKQPHPPAPTIDETPLSDLAASLPPVVPVAPEENIDDLDELASIDPISLASEIHEMQLTLSAADVPRAVREFKAALDLDLNPQKAPPLNGSQPIYVVELSGDASEVSLVLSQLREMSRRGELMSHVGIRKPTDAILATIPPHQTTRSIADPDPSRAKPSTPGAIRVLLVLQSNATP